MCFCYYFVQVSWAIFVNYVFTAVCLLKLPAQFSAQLCWDAVFQLVTLFRVTFLMVRYNASQKFWSWGQTNCSDVSPSIHEFGRIWAATKKHGEMAAEHSGWQSCHEQVMHVALDKILICKHIYH